MIKNLIFDVGNVLIGYRWKDMLMDHGLSEEEALRVGGLVFSEPTIWGKLDGGILSVEDVLNAYADLFPQDIEVIRWFLHNAELMAVPRPQVWNSISDLKARGYRIYILSNYSQELFEKHTAGADFFDHLDGGIVSYQIKQVKPDAGIYLTLFRQYGLKPEECLFFDDRKENIAAAKALGMEGFLVTGEKQLLGILKNLGASFFEKM